jgi:hypothetical protein
MSSSPSFPKLNDSNYEQWRGEMTAWLKKAKVWRIVAGTKTKPTKGDAEIQTFEDDWDRAAGELLLWIEDGQKTHVKDVEDDPQKIWAQLNAAHTSKRPLVRFNAYDDFFSIKMKEGEKMQQVASRVDETMQRIKSLRPSPFTIDDLDKELTVFGMIRALPSETHGGFTSSLFLTSLRSPLCWRHLGMSRPNVIVGMSLALPNMCLQPRTLLHLCVLYVAGVTPLTVATS